MVTSTKANLSGIPAAPSRREFLSYLLGGSVALAAAASCGGVAWFLQQQIGFGEGTGYFQIESTILPNLPVKLRDAHAFLANLDSGLVAFSEICPREGCLVRWMYQSNWFMCPCCGSKFQSDGTYMNGPSPRYLDRWELRITVKSTTYLTPDDGSPLPFADATSIVLNTNRLIYGEPRENSPIWQYWHRR